MIPSSFSSPTAGIARRRAARGFTLIELMVVVLIIGILASIALPSMLQRFRERRSAEAAQRVAALYRGARMRAMGRGSAVLVRFNASGFTLYEALRPSRGLNADCPGEPSSSCLNTTWDVAASRSLLSSFDPVHRSEYEDLTLTAAGPSGAALTDFDVCFAPSGRTYERNPTTAPLSNAMVGAYTFSVQRAPGLVRTVTLLPNGMSRLAL